MTPQQRLEEIKENGLLMKCQGHAFQSIHVDDFDWLISRVDQLEKALEWYDYAYRERALDCSKEDYTAQKALAQDPQEKSE